MASIAGFLLMLLSAGLWRRRRGAYWAALLTLIVGAGLTVLKGLDWEEAFDLLIVAALLALELGRHGRGQHDPSRQEGHHSEKLRRQFIGQSEQPPDQSLSGSSAGRVTGLCS